MLSDTTTRQPIRRDHSHREGGGGVTSCLEEETVTTGQSSCLLRSVFNVPLINVVFVSCCSMDNLLFMTDVSFYTRRRVEPPVVHSTPETSLRLQEGESRGLLLVA